MPSSAKYLRCPVCQKQIISQQTVQKMIYRGQSLHRLGKAGMDRVTWLLGTIPQLPDTKVPQIIPENTNTDPLPIVGWLCMAVGNLRLFWRSGIDAEISGEFRCGILEADAE